MTSRDPGSSGHTRSRPSADPEPGAVIDAHALTDLARAAAVAGGEALLARYHRPSGVGTKSASGDFVSDADRASERAITDLLTTERPGDGLLGEEGAAREADSGIRWVIDPLDGTSNYLYRFGAWTVSIAAQARDGDGWRTVAGVVAEPLSGDVFAATEAAGAWLGDERLRVNDPVALDRALVGTGFAYDVETRGRQGRTVAAVLPRVRDVRRSGSAARDLSFVAAGRLDGYYESSLGPWDMAAGALIAAEAGALVSPLGDGVVAAGPALHPDLERLVVAADQGQPTGGAA